MLNWLIRFALLWSALFNSSIHSLANDQLRRYEVINFQIKPSDRNVQPSVNQGFLQTKGKLLLVEINAFERFFRLVALAGKQLKVRIYENGMKYTTHLNESYFVGYLLDRPGDSKVMGYLTNQRFIGLIYDRKQIFHLDLLQNGNQVIMYRESDVIVEHGRASQPVEMSDFGKLYRPKINVRKRSEQFDRFVRFKRSNRKKSKRHEPILYSRRPVACHVELIADHSFANRFNYDANLIANEMHLQLMKANEIYQNTDFNNDGLPEGVSLRTASIIIFKDENATGYTYSDLNLTPIEILHAFSKRIQDHCLAFTFLYRDFSIFPKFKGTLGLAWLATSGNHAGVCSQPAINKEISTNNIVVTNVGLLTTWFKGKERPRAEVAQTLAHEIGHLFGARHDDGEDLKIIHPDWECPSRYLMSVYASFGETATIFTRCSTWQIDEVLSVKSGCFRELKAFCGNGQIEEGEECDCGPPEMCEKNHDRCCVPNACLIREECKQEFRPVGDNDAQPPTFPHDPYLPTHPPESPYYLPPYHPPPRVPFYPQPDQPIITQPPYHPPPQVPFYSQPDRPIITQPPYHPPPQIPFHPQPDRPIITQAPYHPPPQVPFYPQPDRPIITQPPYHPPPQIPFYPQPDRPIITQPPYHPPPQIPFYPQPNQPVTIPPTYSSFANNQPSVEPFNPLNFLPSLPNKNYDLNGGRPKVFSPQTNSPSTSKGDGKETNLSNEFDAFFNQLSELKWPQIFLIVIIFVSVLYFIRICSDTWFNYSAKQREQVPEMKRKSKHKRKRKRHHRLKDDED